MNQKNKGREIVGSDSQPISKTNVIDACSIAQPKTSPTEKTGGFTVIDWLLARAIARAFFDLDYALEIELARRFAAFQERRAAV